MYTFRLNEMVDYKNLGLNIAAALAIASPTKKDEVYLTKILYSSNADVLLEVGLYRKVDGKYVEVYSDSGSANIDPSESQYIWSMITKHNNALVRMAVAMNAINTNYRLIVDLSNTEDTLSDKKVALSKNNSLIIMASSDNFQTPEGIPKYISKTYTDVSYIMGSESSIKNIINGELNIIMKELHDEECKTNSL